MRDDLEGWLEAASQAAGASDARTANLKWLKTLAKWDNERLYADHVTVQRTSGRPGVPGSRSAVRSYCAQVFKQARLWERIEKSVRIARLDFRYRRNGTRGFVHALSVTRAPRNAKELAYTAGLIHSKARFGTEFTAVTDVPLLEGNDRHRFVRDTLREVRIEPVPVDGFAFWAAKLRPMIH